MSNGKKIRPPRGPLILITLAVAAIAWIQLSTTLEGNFKAPLTILAVFLLLLSLMVWVLAFSGLPRKRRLSIIGASIALIALLALSLALLTRREGSYTGAGMPRFVWKWSPPHVLPPLMSQGASADLSTTTPDDFPQFLGADRDEQVKGVHLSHDWSSTPPQLLWRRPVGLGWSGFAIVNGYAVTMEQRSEQESTICYELLTGKPVWVHANTAHLIEHEGGDGPRATPTIAGGRVYVLGALGNLDCLDGKTGKAIWSQSILADPLHDHLRYGQCSSPLLVDQMLIVTGGTSGPDDQPRPSLMAFDKDTGKPLWQFKGEPPGYASPALVTLAGVRQILLVHAHSIGGHDLTNGHLLWSFPWTGIGQRTSQAVAVGSDRVYCSTGYGIGSVLLQIQGSAGGMLVSELWHTTVMKTEFSNVVIRDTRVYGLDDGYLMCEDLNSGKRLWHRDLRFGHGQVLQVGDVLLVQSEDGDVALVDPQPEAPKELGRITALPDSRTCWNNPALSGQILLVRNEHEAACYRLP